MIWRKVETAHSSEWCNICSHRSYIITFIQSVCRHCGTDEFPNLSQGTETFSLSPESNMVNILFTNPDFCKSCHLLNNSCFTSVGHSGLDDVQCWIIFTQVVGHVPIRVDCQQICTTVEDEQINY